MSRWDRTGSDLRFRGSVKHLRDQGLRVPGFEVYGFEFIVWDSEVWTPGLDTGFGEFAMTLEVAVAETNHARA